MLRLLLYFGLFSTIFCASVELYAKKPKIQSLDKAPKKEILPELNFKKPEIQDLNKATKEEILWELYPKEPKIQSLDKAPKKEILPELYPKEPKIQSLDKAPKKEILPELYPKEPKIQSLDKAPKKEILPELYPKEPKIQSLDKAPKKEILPELYPKEPKLQSLDKAPKKEILPELYPKEPKTQSLDKAPKKEILPELDVPKPEIQSLDKASNKEIPSESDDPKPEIQSLDKAPNKKEQNKKEDLTKKYKNQPIKLKIFQILELIKSLDAAQRIKTLIGQNHLYKLLDSNPDSLSFEKRNSINADLDLFEYEITNIDPGWRRNGKINPKGLTKTKKSYCADALLKISQIASDAYNKLTTEQLDYEDSKLSNVFEKLALPVAGTGEINPYVLHKQKSKDALNFIMGLDPRKTMHGHDFKYRSTEVRGSGNNIQRNESPDEKSKWIHLTFKRPRTEYSYETKKLSQPLYKHLKSYDRTTETSVDTKYSTESTYFNDHKLKYGLNKQHHKNNDDDYPFDLDEFLNLENWDSSDVVDPFRGHYYAWESNPSEFPQNYFYRFSPIENDNHNRERKNVYDSKKKIPVFAENIEVANLAIPYFDLIWNHDQQLDAIYKNSTQAHQYYTKPWKYNVIVVADSSNQPIDYERPLPYKISTGPFFNSHFPPNHDQFDENDKSIFVVKPSLDSVVNNRHAHGHDSNFHPFTNRHEGYISIEDLKGPDNDEFWAYDTYLWNMGIELPEIKYNVPSGKVGKLSKQLFYQPTELKRDVEFINAFPVNLVKPRASLLNYPQINDPGYWIYDNPENMVERASTNTVFHENGTSRITTMPPYVLGNLPASQNPDQIWNYYQNPSEIELTTKKLSIDQLNDTNRDYYQPYVRNPDHHLPYSQNPSEIETFFDPKIKYSLVNHDSVASHKWLGIPADKLVVVSEYVNEKPDYNWPYNENPLEIEMTTERDISINELKDSKFSDFWHYNQNPDYYQPSFHKPITNYWLNDQPYYPSETEKELTTKKYVSVYLNLNHDWPYDQNPDYNWLDDQKPDYYRPYDNNPSGLEIDINTNNIESSPSFTVLPMSTVRPILIDQSPSHYWSFDLNPSESDINDSTERFTLMDHNFDTNPLHNMLPLPMKINKNYINHNPGYWPHYQNPSEIGEIDVTTESRDSVDKVINSKIHNVQSHDPSNYWPYNQNPSDTEILEHETEPTPDEIKWLSFTKRPIIINNEDWPDEKNESYNWQYDQNPDYYSWPYDNNPSEIETITTIAPINYDTNSNPAYNVLPSSTIRPILIKNTNDHWLYDQSPEKYWLNHQDPSEFEIQQIPNNPNNDWSYDHSPDYIHGYDPGNYWYNAHNPDYSQNPSEPETEVTTKSHISIDDIMVPNLDYYRPHNQNPEFYWLYVQNPSNSEIDTTTKMYTIKHNTDSNSIENWWSVNTIGPFDSDQNLDNDWPYDQDPTSYWPNDQNPSKIEIEATTKAYIPVDYNVDKYPTTYDKLLLPPKWSLQIKNYFEHNSDKHRPSNQNLEYWPYNQKSTEIAGKYISIGQVINNNSNLGQYDQNSDFYWPIDQNPSQFEKEVTTKKNVFFEHENDPIPAYIPFYDENARDFIHYQPEKPIPVEAQIDPQHSWYKPIEFEITTRNPVASNDKEPLGFDFLVTTKRPPVHVDEGIYSKKFVFDPHAWNVNKPSTMKVPQQWNYNDKPWDFNIKAPTIRPTLNDYKFTGNTAYIWDYNQYPETVTAKYTVSNENEHLNHNYQESIFNNYWNQPHQISTEGYITIDGISGPQINHLWTSENMWKPEYEDTQEYNIQPFSPGFHVSNKPPNSQNNKPNVNPNDADNEGDNYLQYDLYEITTKPHTTLINLNSLNPWEYNVQITTERPILEHEISDFENSYPKEVTNKILLATEVTTPRSTVSIYDLDYIYDPTLNSDDANVLSIEQTSTNMMSFDDNPITSKNNQSAYLDFSDDIIPSWNYHNQGNLTDFIEVPNYDDDYSEIFNTDVSDLEIDDNIETESQVINLIKQKLGEVEKKAKNENEIRILSLINKIREMISGDVNKDKYVEVLTYYNEINSYLNANMNGQSKMALIINRLYTLPNQKNLEIDTHDHFVEMTYLVRRPKPVIIYPYYYIKYKVPVHKIDELVREDPNIIDEDDNLHIDLLKNSEIGDRSSALKNLTEHDLLLLTIGHGDVVDTKLVSASSNKIADLYKDLFSRHAQLRNREKSRSNLNEINGKATQLTIEQNDKPYDTISIEDRQFPIQEQNGDQLNDLIDPFQKLLPLYKLKQATDKPFFASRRGLNVVPLDILRNFQKIVTVEPLNQNIVNMDKKTTVTEKNNPIYAKNDALNLNSMKNEEHNSMNTNNNAISSNTMKNEELDSVNTENDALKSNTTKNEELESVNTKNDALNSYALKKEEHNSINTENHAHSSNTIKNEKHYSGNTESEALHSNTMKNEERDSFNSENEALNSNTMKNDVTVKIEVHNSINAKNDALRSTVMKNEEHYSNTENYALNSNTLKTEYQDSVDSENEANSKTIKKYMRYFQSTEIEEYKPINAKNDAVNSKTLEIDEFTDEHNSSKTGPAENVSTTAKRESYVPSGLQIEKNRNLRA